MDTPKPWLRHYPPSVSPSIGPFPDINAYGLLADAARRYPDRPAIAWFGRHLDYLGLERECERFAGALAGLGIGTWRPSRPHPPELPAR